MWVHTTHHTRTLDGNNFCFGSCSMHICIMPFRLDSFSAFNVSIAWLIGTPYWRCHATHARTQFAPTLSHWSLPCPGSLCVCEHTFIPVTRPISSMNIVTALELYVVAPSVSLLQHFRRGCLAFIVSRSALKLQMAWWASCMDVSDTYSYIG